MGEVFFEHFDIFPQGVSLKGRNEFIDHLKSVLDPDGQGLKDCVAEIGGDVYPLYGGGLS
ncbi:hypothetical protein MBAV_003381 [Candidatus Magnetobacterium bavaricum]|uniref:Uncharacterized protein n=1 Tax=Candidatus Magnetobacterium bavaricum TaxID=29290 RepID=A0A0F3GR52_9BACT|nr:hypothetical protein MBAV_003381 [Candidatus Magnetobacterium bavaricum]